MRIIAKDLLPGKTYHLQFRSKNAGEVSEWGHSHEVTIGTATSKPLAPTGVTLESVSDSFHANWNRVTHSEDGLLATDLAGYVVRFRNVINNQTATFETPDTSFELTFNLNFAMFTPIAGQIGVTIAAKNNMGVQSDWSEEVITQNPPPGPVRNLVAEGIMDGIAATWEPPENLEDDFKEYRVYVGTSEVFSPTNPVWTGVGTSAVYYTSTKVNHWVKVIAYDKFNGASTVVTAGPVMPKSSVEADVDAPDTPTNLDGSISGQRLTVTWTAPANPDNDLAGYQIGYRPAGQTGWSYATASHEDTSVVIEPITRFVNYETKIQAHDFSFNYSSWSAIDTVTGEVNTPPATPTGVQVKGAITTAMVVWNANTEADLAGYEVQFEDHTPTEADEIYSSTGRVISFVENVTTDTLYYARVRAVDLQGLKSSWSPVASGAVGYVDFTEINDRLDNVITDSVVQYAVSASDTVPPTSGWSTSTPTYTPGSYIWFRSVITYGDGSGSTSDPALLTGNDGAQGEPGSDGVSVTGIQPFFRVVTKGAAAPAQPTGTADPSGWTTTEPAFTMDTELYRTERVTYSNSTASWTPVTKVSSYTGIDEVNTIAITADRRVRKSNVPPVVGDGAGAPVGALWYEYGAATAPGTGTVLKQTYEWTGSAWQTRGIDRTFIPQLDIANGTFGELTGGRIVADSIGADKIKTEEIAADQAFLDNLVVTTGHISDLTFDKITGGSGILSDVTVKSTMTLGDASTNGVIQSHGYSASTGFKIDKTGIIINQGSISASALNIQFGQNLLRPEYADFEFSNQFYTGGIVPNSNVVTSIITSGARFNKQSLRMTGVGSTATTSPIVLTDSVSNTNIPVEAGKTYIVSLYTKTPTATATSIAYGLLLNNGADYQLLEQVDIPGSQDWTRRSVAYTIPSGYPSGGAIILWLVNSTSASVVDIDGIQVEEQIGAISTPSAWSSPGTSSIDGAMIRTGEIRSNTNVTVNGVSQPMWSINMTGGMQIGSAVIRGNLTVGATSDADGSVIQSSNYVAGVSGFVMRGSDGFAEFQNLLVNLNSTTPGQIIVGTLDEGGQTIITGGAGGGVKFFIPEADAPVAEFGRNVLARNATGETVASMGDDGVVSGQTGIFENLTVAGKDVTESVTRDDSTVVVLDDTGDVGTGYGPYATETGFREVGFFAEPNRVYKVENWVHIINTGTSSGTFFTYLRYTKSPNPTTAAAAPLISSSELSSNDGAISVNAEGRFFNTGYVYANSSGQNVRLLITARGGGTRTHRFVRSRFAVTDLGTYDPLVTSGRFSLGGASGAPAPVPEPPPQLYKKWYDFSWEEVYQISGPAPHGSGGLGSKTRMGRVGSTSNYPWGTMLGLPSALVSDLSGAEVKKAGIRLTSVSWMDGAVISGYATASSAPSNMPTTPSGASNIGTLPKGATKTMWLPSSYYTTLKTSSRALTLGRLNSSGYNDTFIETANISAGTGSRPRLYVEYEK